MPGTFGTRNHIQREQNKIKCVDCSRMQEPSEYSEKQLSILREKIRKLGLATVKDGEFIRCIMCAPKVAVELECTMCFTIKRVDDFAKIQRKDRETATCKECMLEKLAIDPVLNPNSSYMKSLGMTEEEANTSTWTTPSASDALAAPATTVQPRPVTAHTTRVERWGKNSAIPKKEVPITATSGLVDVSDIYELNKLQTSSWVETKTSPTNMKSFASAAAASCADAWDTNKVVSARQPATTPAWNWQAIPSAGVAALPQSLKSATISAVPVTSKNIKQEPLDWATTIKSSSSAKAKDWEATITPPRSTQQWDMPATASWETFGTQIEHSVTNVSGVWSPRPAAPASYVESIASTNTEPCSPTSPASVTNGLGKLTMGGPGFPAVYSAEEWQAITDKGRNARRGRYYGQPGGGGSGGKRGGR